MDYLPRFMTLGCLALAAPAFAEDMPIELKGCVVTEATVIDKAGDVIIGASTSRGVTDRVRPASFPAKTFHQCRVVWTLSKTGVKFDNRCNFVDADGDRIISVASGSPQLFKWQWIAGTGKFAGILGHGTGTIGVGYPRPNPALSGGCWSAKGSYRIGAN